MTEVVLLVSSLVLADLRDGEGRDATAVRLMQEAQDRNATVNLATAFPDPERKGASFLTIRIGDDAAAFVETICDLDGVLSCYVKPQVELP
ncbi:MAG: hypothetical protein OXR62_16920 [Ahrensia sp.]|nr:hypothetical protein [Ahrensia sp.]